MVLGVAAIAVGALPATASAGTASLESTTDDRSSVTTDALLYIAAPGERNRVTVSRGGPNAVDVTDSAGVTPGRGCRRIGSGLTRVRCTRINDELSGGSVKLGDGGDTAALGGGFAPDLDGGSGNDTLSGDPERTNVFIGGSGDDSMVGGSSDDIFDEGSAPNGSDTMVGGGDAGAGGNGDSVTYADRRGRVAANLDGRRNDGARDERDQIGPDVEALLGGRGRDRLSGNNVDNTLIGGGGSDVLKGRGGRDQLSAGSEFSAGRARTRDKLYGGSGPDVLDGTRGRNVLSGGSGADTIDGAAGADRIRGGRGRDRITGGSGADRIVTRRDRARDRVNCGSGTDRLRADRRDRRRRCERVRLG